MSFRDVLSFPQEFLFRLGNQVHYQKLTFRKCWFGVESLAWEALLFVPVGDDAFQRHLPARLTVSFQGDHKYCFAHFMHPSEHSICAQ